MKKVIEEYKMTELGEIPKDWEVIQFEKLYAIPSKNGVSCPKAVRGVGYKMINMNELFAYDIIRNPEMELVPLNKREIDEFYIEEGDLLFARQSLVASGAGKCSIVMECPEVTTFESHIIRVRLKKDIVDPLYYYYYFSSGLGRNNINSLITQVAAAGIRGSELKKVKVPKPSLNEQKKISSILITIDEYIQETEILMEKTKELKKGLMQRLLTKGIGHTRFKKTEVGEIPVEWRIKSLNEVTEIMSGGTPDTKNTKYWDGGDIYWATPTDITSNGKYINHTEKCITQEGLKNSSAYLLPIGSVLMTSRATIGETCINTVPMATNQGFKSFICKDNLYNEYLYYYIDIIKPDFIKLSGGSTFLEISKKEVEAYKIPVPPVEEQKAVATIISEVDNQIVFNQEKLKRLEKLKRGLMQKLLTGKLRVSIK